MRKMVTVLAVLGLIVGSCGGSDADSCEGLADQSIDVVQRWLDELDAMTPEEMLATEEPGVHE